MTLREKTEKKFGGILMLILMFQMPPDLFALEPYVMRPHSEYSKLVSLIDHFADSEIEVVYDGHYYSAAFAGRMARWFLFRRYKKEDAEKWVMRWCHTSAATGHLIWVKLPNGKFLPAREVLLEELKAKSRSINLGGMR